MKLFAILLAIPLIVAGVTYQARWLAAMNHERDRVAAMKQEAIAVAELCAEQGGSAFRHVASGRFFCMTGSGRLTPPLANPIRQP